MNAQESRPERMMFAATWDRYMARSPSVKADRGTLLRRAWWLLTIAAVAYWTWYSFTRDPNNATDAWAYYRAGADHLYDQPLGSIGAFLYSPAFYQVLEPLRGLPFPTFNAIFRAAELVALVVLAGPILPLTSVVLGTPLDLEIIGSNVQLLMAAAIAAGFRWPAAWAFVLLTKITPGVGLVWFAVRREWRHLAIALGATAVVMAVSVAMAPNLWRDWAQLLLTPGRAYDPRSVVTFLPPLLVRLPVAALLVAWGARREYRWTVYVAAFLALPVPWVSGLVLLVPALRPGVLQRVSRLRLRDTDVSRHDVPTAADVDASDGVASRLDATDRVRVGSV